MMRVAAAVGTAVLAVLGLLTWEIVALVVSFLALIIACIALWRTEMQAGEVERWSTSQLERAQAQGEALSHDLGD